MQERGLLITRRWYAHCMPSESFMKSTSHAWHTIGTKILLGEMSPEWIREMSDSGWQGLLSSIQPTSRPLPLLSTRRWNAVGAKSTLVMLGTPRGTLVYKKWIELPTHADLPYSPICDLMQVWSFQDSPPLIHTHFILAQRQKVTGAPAAVVKMYQSPQRVPQALAIVQEFPCREWECKAGTT